MPRPGSKPTVLAADLASGGASAALIDSNLTPLRVSEISWTFSEDGKGSATLSPGIVNDALTRAIRSSIEGFPPPEAIVLSSMMHTLLARDEQGRAKSEIFTWLDHQGGEGVRQVEEALGVRFLSRTGVRFHPMFPVFKLAWLRSTAPAMFEGGHRFGSLKSSVIEELTGQEVEDTSSASASGLLNLESGKWDSEVLDLLHLSTATMPRIVDPAEIVGHLKPEAADRFGLPPKLPVVAGGGDGFLANIGSGCENATYIAVTCGTTASVRKLVHEPVVDPEAGTFCYRYDQTRFLLGCASNNGGNVLDWGRQVLEGLEFNPGASPDPPLFIPFLRGERSPFWNSRLRAEWHELAAEHDIQDLRRAVVEALAFHLAIYVEQVDGVSGLASDTAVLSGNGFKQPALASLLASVIPQRTRIPTAPGLATLRGAARCAFRAMETSTDAAMEGILQEAATPASISDPALRERFKRFKSSYWAAGKHQALRSSDLQ